MPQKDKQGLPNAKKQTPDEELFLEDTSIISSATECTGLIPTPPVNSAEAESYTELYPIPEPENKVDNGFQQPRGIHGKMTKKKN